MAGGLPVKKWVLTACLDHPVKTYLTLGTLLYAFRQYQIRSTYNWHFGKFEFERQREAGKL